MEQFTDELRQAAVSLWQKSKAHPFIKELESGKLPLAKFRFYLLQDHYYLRQFSQVHYQLAEKSAVQANKDFLIARAKDLISSEVAMQEQFFKALNVSSAEIDQIVIAPANYNYVNHLFVTAKENEAVGIAALVPCYWLYQEVGQAMADHGSPVKYYQEWIDTYDSDWYAVNVNKMLDLVNCLAADSDEKTRKLMKFAFVRSSYYELDFWQMAYSEEKWV